MSFHMQNRILTIIIYHMRKFFKCKRCFDEIKSFATAGFSDIFDTVYIATAPLNSGAEDYVIFEMHTVRSP